MKINKLHRELAATVRKEQQLRERKVALLKSIGTLQEAFHLVTSQSPNGRARQTEEKLAVVSTAFLNENTRIGDAIWLILKEHGAMTQKHILEHLRRHRVRISVNSPYQVLSNTLRKDRKGRFVIISDGSVSLRENE